MVPVRTIDTVVVLPLGKSKEEGKQESHQGKPSANEDVGGETAYQHSHDEAYGDDGNVKDSMLFQLDTVSDIHPPVA